MYTMSFDPAELQATLTKLATVNQRRANLIEYRNRQLREAIEAGHTWTEIQRMTGLSRRGLALALKR